MFPFIRRRSAAHWGIVAFLGISLGWRVEAQPSKELQSGLARADSTPYPSYQPLRYDEDYRYLRDPARRTDPLDKIKYIPLRPRESWFLTLGGELRWFYEHYTNEAWGNEIPGRNDYFLQRYMGHADAHLGRHVRIFVQLKSGLENGRRGGPRPPDEDRMDINQVFLDASVGSPTNLWTLRLGRHELELGAGRLISIRELPNVRQSFDGLRLTGQINRWTLNALGVRPAQTNPGWFDDRTDPTQWIWSFYSTYRWRMGGTLEGYYVGSSRERAVLAQGVAAERRHTFGARLAYSYRHWNGDAEVFYQVGSLGPGRIRAWAISGHTEYFFSRHSPWKLGLDAGLNSGDRNPNHPDNQTFMPPAPRGAYFGAIGANGPANIAGLAPSVSVRPGRGVSLKGYCYFFWRQSLRDGVYNIPGFPSKINPESRSRYMGTQPELDLMWQWGRHHSLTGVYANFFPGAFIRDSPPDGTIAYWALWYTFKF